jgi:hypothetical protein
MSDIRAVNYAGVAASCVLLLIVLGIAGYVAWRRFRCSSGLHRDADEFRSVAALTTRPNQACAPTKQPDFSANLQSWPEEDEDTGQTEAAAMRVDHVGGLVWECDGTATEVLHQLVELPAPSDRLAPRLVRTAAPRWRTS